MNLHTGLGQSNFSMLNLHDKPKINEMIHQHKVNNIFKNL